MSNLPQKTEEKTPTAKEKFITLYAYPLAVAVTGAAIIALPTVLIGVLGYLSAFDWYRIIFGALGAGLIAAIIFRLFTKKSIPAGDDSSNPLTAAEIETLQNENKSEHSATLSHFPANIKSH